MKFYDKELTRKSEEINKIIWILIIFIISFLLRCFSMNLESKKHIEELEKVIEEKQDKIDEQFIELDSLRETVYMYQVYGK